MTITLKFGVCNFSTVDFIKFCFSGGETPLEPPLKVVGGVSFWVGRGLVHDYTYKVWSLFLDYFYFF